MLVGCATDPKMPLIEGLDNIDTSKKSILIAKVKIKNENRPQHQPELYGVLLKKNNRSYFFIKNKGSCTFNHLQSKKKDQLCEDPLD